MEDCLGRVGLHQNPGEFADADTLTIKWFGLIPGKRESRRFLGDTLLCQQGIIAPRDHYDTVAYGGCRQRHLHHSVSGAIQPVAG